MKTIISIFMVLLISGCATTWEPQNAVYVPSYVAPMPMMYNHGIYSNPYIRPAMHTTCTQTAGFVNCNSY